MTVPRQIFVNGETLVLVKGRSDSPIANLAQLGLCDSPIELSPDFNHLDVIVDAWGRAPADIQFMNATFGVRMTLVHFDPTVLAACVSLAMGGVQAFGQTARAGTLMGGQNARFAPGNNYIGLNLTSPVAALPWCFYYSYLDRPPFVWPIGTERSLVTLNWRIVPFTPDPWQGGFGALNNPLWGNVLDS